MSNQNYVPFGAPNIQGRMYGPGNAVEVAESEMRASAAQQQSLRDMALAHQMQQAQLERYQGMTPHELAIKGWEAEQARGRQNMPGYLPSLLAGEMGQHQSLKAKGDFDTQTLGSRVAETNSENGLKAIGNTIQQMQVQLAGAPVMQREAAYQQFLTGIPSELRMRMPRNYDPQTVQAIGDALVNTPAHRQTMAKEAEHTRRSNYTADRGLEGAKYTADARLEASMYNSLSKEQKAKLDTITAQLLEKLANGTITDQEVRTLQYIQQFRQGIAAAGQQSSMDPNYLKWLMLQGPGQNPPPRPQPAPSPVPLPQGGDSQMKAKVEAAGYAYEPNRYDYRIGPNGQVQRAPK